MADIKFYCPHCQHKLGVDSSAAGYFVNCPECEAHIRIPEESTIEPPRLTLPQKTAKRAQPSDLDVTQPISGILERGATPDAAEKPALTKRILHLEKERTAFEEALRKEQARSESTAHLEAKIADLLQQLENAQVRVHKAEAKAMEATKAKEAAEQAHKGRPAKSKTLETRSDEALKKEKETLTAKLETAHGERDKLRKAVTELETKLATAQQDTDKVKTLLAEKRDLQTQLRNELDEKDRASSLQTSTDEIRNEALALASKLSKAETRAERLSAEKKELTERAATADKARMEAAAKEQAARKQVVLISEEKKQLEATIKLVKEKTEGIQGKVDFLEQQAGRVTDLEATVSDLTKKNQALSASSEALPEEPKPAADTAAAAPPVAAPVASEPAGGAGPPGPSRPAKPKPPPPSATQPKQGRAAPAEKGSGDRSAQGTTRKAAIPRPPTRLPKRAPRTGSMYRKVPRRAGGRPSRVVVLAILVPVLLLLIGTLFAFVMPEQTARWIAPIRSLFGGKPGLDASGGPLTLETIAPSQPAALATAKGPGSSVIVDEVRIGMDGVKLEPVTRIDSLGQKTLTEQPYLVVDITLKNTTADKELFMIHGWDRSTLTDGLGGSSRPAFPSHFSLDRVVGTQGATELAPGTELHYRIIFAPPKEEATDFTMLSDPGIWRKTVAGRFAPVSDTRVTFSFSRDDIEQAP